jgi:hypothetical protein
LYVVLQRFTELRSVVEHPHEIFFCSGIHDVKAKLARRENSCCAQHNHNLQGEHLPTTI